VFVARYAGLNIGMLWSLMVFRNLVGREEVERVCFPIWKNNACGSGEKEHFAFPSNRHVIERAAWKMTAFPLGSAETQDRDNAPGQRVDNPQGQPAATMFFMT
jgi:hypothetical protein